MTGEQELQKGREVAEDRAGEQVPQLTLHTCLGRGTSQLLSVGGSPEALLGCTEADMDF